MPYAHFTPDTRNQLAALLRAKVKKKNIAKQLAKERRIKANSRFRKIENDKFLRRYIVIKWGQLYFSSF